MVERLIASVFRLGKGVRVAKKIAWLLAKVSTELMKSIRMHLKQ